MAFGIIKLAVNSRFTFLSRAADSGVSLPAARSFDAAIDDALFSLAKHTPARFPATHRRREVSAMLRSLPLHLGGFGVHRHSWTFGQVGTLKVRALVRDFVDSYFPDLDAAAHLVAPVVLGAGDPMNLLHEFQPAFEYANSEDMNWAAIEEAKNTLMEHSAQLLLEHLFNHCGVPRAIWFRSEQFDGSGRFLVSPAERYQPPHLRLSREEYLVAFRQRLLLGPFDDLPMDNQPHGLCTCGNHPLVAYNEPYHLLDCNADAFHSHRHHEAARVVLKSFLKQKIPTLPDFIHEPALHDADGRPTTLRADLAISGPNMPYHAIDVVVTNPSANCWRRDVTRNSLLENSNNMLPTDQMEARKRRVYRDTREVLDNEFVPFAIEATGRVGHAASAFVDSVVPFPDILRDRGFKPPIATLQSQLGIAITKVNAAMTLHRTRIAWLHRAAPVI